jgi:flagellar basal-body rod protein FlgB
MSIFEDLATSGPAPVLERMIRFAGARQRLLSHNIANIDTPNFIPFDVSPRDFQEHLRDAVRQRRESGRSESGELEVPDSDEVTTGSDGEMKLVPRTPSGNILYHDRNNRDLERMMQALSENQMAFKAAADLLKHHNDLLRTAISQRV